jgi:hypothetical protein
LACLAGDISDEDAEQLVDVIEKLEFAFSDYVKRNAAACYTELTGTPSEFENGLGLTIDPDTIEVVKQNMTAAENLARSAAAEKEKLEDELSLKAELAPKIRKEIKCALLRDRKAVVDELALHEKVLLGFRALIAKRQQEARLGTLMECNRWATEDMRAAMTNTVCHQIFSESGLPNSKIEGLNLSDVVEARTHVVRNEGNVLKIDQQLEAIKIEELMLTTFSEREILKKRIEFEQQVKRDEKISANKNDCEQAWEVWLTTE